MFTTIQKEESALYYDCLFCEKKIATRVRRRFHSELLPPGLLLPIRSTGGNNQYNTTYFNYIKIIFVFSLRKGTPSVLYRDIYFKDYRKV